MIFVHYRPSVVLTGREAGVVDTWDWSYQISEPAASNKIANMPVTCIKVPKLTPLDSLIAPAQAISQLQFSRGLFSPYLKNSKIRPHLLMVIIKPAGQAVETVYKDSFKSFVL